VDHRLQVRGTLSLLTCALWLLLSLSAVSAAPLAAGHLSGQLLDGSRHSAPLANQSVTLQLTEGTTARDLLSLTTDAQGRYAFGGLQSDASVRYALYTLYQGAQYVSDLIDLGKKPVQQVNLTVYDATTSIANLAVVQTSILLDKPNAQSGLLTISEDIFFENLGLTTYVGKLDASHGRPNALLFALPPGARFLALAAGFAGYNTVQVENGFASNAALPPGTSEFSFSFQVPYSGRSYDFTYQALYPTLSLTLLTPTNLLTTPQGLSSQGPTTTGSGTYQLFLAKRLSAQSSVGAQLAGLPALVQSTPPLFDEHLLWLVALLGALLLASGALGYRFIARQGRARRGRGASGQSGSYPAGRKQRVTAPTKEALLRELLEVDRTYEAGRLDKALYRERRAHIKARLRALMDTPAEQMAEKAASRGNGRGTP
jgi:5-hydroxyisourate hydrolase-like protein (transthyretin family)